MLDKVNLRWVYARPKWLISTCRRSKENINISYQFCTDIADKWQGCLWGWYFVFGTSLCIATSVRNRWYQCVSLTVVAKLSQQWPAAWRSTAAFSKSADWIRGWSFLPPSYVCRDWEAIYNCKQKWWMMMYQGEEKKAGRTAFTCGHHPFVTFLPCKSASTSELAGHDTFRAPPWAEPAAARANSLCWRNPIAKHAVLTCSPCYSWRGWAGVSAVVQKYL